MPKQIGLGLASVVALAPGWALADAPVIEHQKVKCIVAEQYPRMDADITPVEVAQARVYFKPEGVPTWYYVNMKRVPKGYEGVLPKPKKQMIGKHIIYYLEATAKDLGQATSEETDPRVVAKKEDCKNEPVAGFASHPPAAVFPNVPAGFAAGGAAAAPVAAAGVAAAGGAAVVIARNKKETHPPATPSTPPPPSPSPTPPPATTPSDPCANNLPPRGDFDIAPNPAAGPPPLLVRFNNCRSSDPEGDPLLFSYDFGDGTADADPGTPCRLDHTYTRPGTYDALVCVGDACRPRASCKRYSVDVRSPVPPIPAFTLNVATAGSGSGSVTGTGIACPGDCSQTFTSGTSVTLTATPSGNAFFSGWSGDVPTSCAGAPSTCTIVMDAAKSVVASFGPTFTLTLTKADNGTGTVVDDQVPQQINCAPSCSSDSGNYTSGTLVTLTASANSDSTFGGWSGPDVPASCLATGPPPANCTVPMDAAKSITATFSLIRFGIQVGVDGAGTVTDTVPGGTLSCGPSPPPCNSSVLCGVFGYPSGSSITLVENHGANAVFRRWSGDCAGSGPSCGPLVMNSDRNMGATFGHTISVSLTNSCGGAGSVTSVGQSGTPGLSCAIDSLGNVTGTCSTAYDFCTIVTLTRTAFGDWTGGACAGVMTPTCDVTMDQNQSLTVDFAGVCVASRNPPTPHQPRGPESRDQLAPETGLSRSLRWVNRFDVPGASGQVAIGGESVGVEPGISQPAALTRPGEVEVQAELVRGAGKPGSWRFDFEGSGGFQAGSLRVLQGEVALLTDRAVVFRLRGQAGERVAFAFELK